MEESLILEAEKVGPSEAGDDLAILDSATLIRLLDEVRNDEPSEPHAYNRMHNRHNR